MRILSIVAICLALGAGPAAARTIGADPLAGVAFLVGDWTGVAEGEPGTSASQRHAVRVHNGHFIQVQGRSVYPRQPKNKSGEVHTSTDLWSYDGQRKRIVLRQFDSLGFVSTYVEDPAASTAGRIVLTSEHLENVPAGWKARYTYEYRAPDTYHELFELSTGSAGFKPYVAGTFLRATP